MVSILILPLLLYCNMYYSNAYKILVFAPRFAHSHVNFMGNIADVMFDAGHDVTVLQPILDINLHSSGIKKAKLITTMGVDNSMEVNKENHFEDVWHSNPKNVMWIISKAQAFSQKFEKACEMLLDNKTLISELEQEHFDLGISELFEYCGLGLFHVIKTRAIVSASSTGLFDHVAMDIGVPLVPSYVPGLLGVSQDKMSLMQRMLNTLAYFSQIYSFKTIQSGIQKIYNTKYGKDFPSMEDLTANSVFFLTNSEPLLDFARPTLHKVVDIGGIGIREPHKLSMEFDNILNRRPHTVLVSFGSLAKSSQMPLEYRSALLGAMAEISDTTFIWKYEDLNDTFTAGVNNVVLKQWLPQNDLLNDPRLSAFITHGGMGSIQEAASRGVPLLVVPLFADQSRNAHIIEKYGMGQILAKTQLADKQTLLGKINNIVHNEKTRENARRIANMLSKRPFSSCEKLIRYIEFACDHGELPQLNPAGRQLSFLQYYLIDILIIVAAVVSGVLITVAYVSMLLLRYISSKKVKTA